MKNLRKSKKKNKIAKKEKQRKRWATCGRGPRVTHGPETRDLRRWRVRTN